MGGRFKTCCFFSNFVLENVLTYFLLSGLNTASLLTWLTWLVLILRPDPDALDVDEIVEDMLLEEEAEARLKGRKGLRKGR